MKKRAIVAHVGLAMAVIVVGSLAYAWIYVPMTNDYSFTTITKVSNEYEKPIHITFDWTTEDELQVGKEIQLEAKIT